MTARAHRPVEPSTERAPEVQAPSAAAGSTGNSDEVHALFDAGEHIELGDGVDGAPVVIQGLSFTPGHIACLVDFVGTPDVLWGYDHADLVAIHDHLLHSKSLQKLEDPAFWDPITEKYGQSYSDRAQENEDHFAPGSHGGPDFAQSFLGLYTEAYRLAQSAVDTDDPEQADQLRNMARALGYGAEHYLHDAYSAGHQISSGDVTAQVDAVLSPTNLVPVSLEAGALVFAEKQAELAGWEVRNVGMRHVQPPGPLPDPGLYVPKPTWSRLDTLGEWQALVSGGAVVKNFGGVYDAIRKEIHERLGESQTPVLVTTELHPEPFALGGDHAPSPVSESALLAALEHARDILDHPTPQDPATVAAAVWERVRTRPTAETQALVQATLDECTRGEGALAAALAGGVSRTLPEVMHELESKGLVRKADGQAPSAPAEDAPEVEIPENDPAAPSWVDRARGWDTTRPEPFTQAW